MHIHFIFHDVFSFAVKILKKVNKLMMLLFV